MELSFFYILIKQPANENIVFNTAGPWIYVIVCL